MNKGLSYLKGGIYQLGQNKAYALFCILGTAFTFVFIIIILQLAYTLTGKVPPFVNADRTIVFRLFEATDGRVMGGIPPEDTFPFLEQVPLKEDYYISYPTIDQVKAGGKYHAVNIAFVNAGYWRVNCFDFLFGKDFTEEECENRKTLIVVTEKIARKFFNKRDAVGEKVEVQGRIYTVGGVVADYSTFGLSDVDIWLPYTFNKFVPDGTRCYEMGVLAPEKVDMEEMKGQVAQVILNYWRQRGIDVSMDADKLGTLQEMRLKTLGDNVLSYGVPIAVLLLLLIPAINIVALNFANAHNIFEEVALRRALGATIRFSFWWIVAKNFVLAVVGVAVGLVLVWPMADGIGLLLDRGIGGNISLLNSLNYQVILFGVLPLVMIFVLLSGGLPARWAAKSNVAIALKGGQMQVKGRWRQYLGILVEQMFVFVVLMVSCVSVVIAVKQYREPGLLDVDRQLMFGYMLHDIGEGMSWTDMKDVSANMNVLLESLRQSKHVEGVTESMGLIPYLRADEGYGQNVDTIREGDKRVGVLMKAGDGDAQRIFELQLVEGGWFGNELLEDGSCPAVITRQLAEQLGWSRSLGKEMEISGNTFTVVGVIAGLKQQVFGELYPIMIVPLSVMGANPYFREFCVKYRPDQRDECIALLNKEFQRLGMDKKALLIFYDMEDMKKDSMSGTVTNLVMQVVPTVFLVFFAFIGTFGLFWLTAKRRRREFALRMVMGSTRRGLTRLVVMEGLCVTGLAMVPGLLLSFFIYDWTATQALAIGLTVLLMLLFSVFSAWWPARQVARLHPADVLREE